eukprot:11733236-Ditylum_brightwellii.AAC.1
MQGQQHVGCNSDRLYKRMDKTNLTHERNTNKHNTATSDIGSFMQEHDHIDTTRYPHGEFTPPSTYQRGQHKIDYIFIMLKKCSSLETPTILWTQQQEN